MYIISLTPQLTFDPTPVIRSLQIFSNPVKGFTNSLPEKIDYQLRGGIEGWTDKKKDGGGE